MWIAEAPSSNHAFMHTDGIILCRILPSVTALSSISLETQRSRA